MLIPANLVRGAIRTLTVTSLYLTQKLRGLGSDSNQELLTQIFLKIYSNFLPHLDYRKVMKVLFFDFQPQSGNFEVVQEL